MNRLIKPSITERYITPSSFCLAEKTPPITNPTKGDLMDPEIVEEIRKIGKVASDIGRMLQTNRKNWLTRAEVHELRMALQHLTKALSTYEKMIPKK